MLTLYLAPDGELYVLLQDLLAQDQVSIITLPTVTTPRKPGPKKPRRSIPSIEWSAVVRRVVDNEEPLRKVAEDYGVSYETVRRTINRLANDGKVGMP